MFFFLPSLGLALYSLERPCNNTGSSTNEKRSPHHKPNRLAHWRHPRNVKKTEVGRIEYRHKNENFPIYNWDTWKRWSTHWSTHWLKILTTTLSPHMCCKHTPGNKLHPNSVCREAWKAECWRPTLIGKGTRERVTITKFSASTVKHLKC